MTTNIGVFGTGTVGQAIAAKLSELGHDVCIGTRDPEATLARNDNDMYGGPPFRVWHEAHAGVRLGTLSEAAAHGDLLVNATSGAGSIAALTAAGAQNLAGKVLLDIANPLDFSRGMPPTLSVCNTDSLGEQIQRTFPDARVVKALNTMNAWLMVEPRRLADGAHTVFMSGNDAAAKATVAELLRSFGWQDVLDLGDITSARGTEMVLPIWLRVFGALQNPMFSLRVVR